MGDPPEFIRLPKFSPPSMIGVMIFFLLFFLFPNDDFSLAGGLAVSYLPVGSFSFFGVLVYSIFFFFSFAAASGET